MGTSHCAIAIYACMCLGPNGVSITLLLILKFNSLSIINVLVLKFAFRVSDLSMCKSASILLDGLLCTSSCYFVVLVVF